MLRGVSSDALTLPLLRGLHEGMAMAQRYMETLSKHLTDGQIMNDPRLTQLYDDDQEVGYDV
jgi:hypothetical protein